MTTETKVPRLRICYQILPILVFALISIGYYWNQVTGAFLPFAADPGGSDLLGVHYTYLTHAHRAWREGVIPLWSSLLGGGTPWFAEGISAFFYPLTIIFSYLFSESTSFLLLFPVHSFLASVAMYYLARTLGIGRAGAVFSGIAWAYSGYFVGHLKHVNYFMSAALVPLPLAWLLQYERKRAWRWIVLSATVFALVLFAGSAQVLYQSLLLWGIVVVCLVIRSFFRIIRTAVPRRDKLLTVGKDLIRWLRYVLVVIVGFVILASIQLIPTWELTRYASRQNIAKWEWAIGFPFHPQNLLTFISPFRFGNPAFLSYEYTWDGIVQSVGLFWENIGYIGLLPLAFSFAAVPIAVRMRAWRMWIMLILLILGVSLVLGPYLPVYRWFWDYMLLFDSFRVPGRYLLWVTLSLAAFAGFALDALLQKLASLPKPKLSPATIILVSSGIVATTLFDLGTFNYYYNAMDRLDVARWSHSPQAAKYLREQAGQYRYSSLFSGEDFSENMRASGGWHNDLFWVIENRELLPPNYSLIYDAASFDHYTPLSLKRSDAYRTALFKNFFSKVSYTRGDPAPTYIVRDNMAMKLGAANIKYLLAPVLLDNPNLKEVSRLPMPHSSRFVFLYENILASSRAYFATSLAMMPSYQDAASHFTNGAAPTATSTLVETDIPLSTTATQATARVLDSRPGAYTIETTSDGAAFLVLNESYYPGWEARLDREPSDIYPANLAFQGIMVPEGEHTVEFRFRSKTFMWGAAISGIGWLSLICILVFKYFKRYQTSTVKLQ